LNASALPALSASISINGSRDIPRTRTTGFSVRIPGATAISRTSHPAPLGVPARHVPPLTPNWSVATPDPRARRNVGRWPASPSRSPESARPRMG
jgi:hypothetical protein